MKLLIGCPCCGNEVSTLAEACPLCGFPVVLYTRMEGLYETCSDSPLELVALNPQSPPMILDVLCAKGGPVERIALTRNPNVSYSILRELADDAEDDVRAALASCPSLPEEIMEMLSGDECCSVIEALYHNPATPEYIRDDLDQRLFEADDYYEDEDTF